VYLHFQRPTQAIALLEYHLKLLQQTGMRPFEVDAHELLAEVLESMAEHQKALMHYKTHMSLYRQMFSKTHEEHTRALGVLVRTQIAEREAEAQRQKNLELRETLEQLERLNQQIVNVSFTDELTGVRNRRYLMTQGASQMKEARGKDFSIAMLDLDHFKRINDTLGHDGGDQVLCEFVRVLQAQLRSQDTLARFGGEEFALLLPHTSPQAACDVLERIRTVMSSRTWESLPAGQKVTFTAGVSESSDGDLMNALRQADTLLYMGKSKGRDSIWR
jgi:diguanylate cyclase (GGDEF)-like protein